MLFLIVCAFSGVILFEVPSLIRNKYWRELVVFSALLSISFIIVVLQTLGFQLPSPAKGLDYIVENVLHLNYH
ncbi:hypothetical protein SAMN05443529_12170 [Desulfosporosinus hippei DSM 8344]|uniref:Uncharacterized protein n=1 Tax=Desulfosporosinus hippei DSM 8344 TaxID=1121419 RepID=A0A1G8G5W4_9FIRM|nr:hypothetical protein SAMN05443529_12170 [Desulfosporosinus hippei DSM 8344]